MPDQIKGRLAILAKEDKPFLYASSNVMDSPAMEEGPRVPQRKYMQSVIWRGALQTMLM
jgi:hypothetical protein